MYEISLTPSLAEQCNFTIRVIYAGMKLLLTRKSVKLKSFK